MGFSFHFGKFFLKNLSEIKGETVATNDQADAPRDDYARIDAAVEHHKSFGRKILMQI